MTDDERNWLKRRIEQLNSRLRTVGPFRSEGIRRTIAGMKEQLRTGDFKAHGKR